MVEEKKERCPFCNKDHETGTMVCPVTGLSLRFADPQRAIGEVIGGKYRLDRVIGKGGMGSVYEAVNLQLGKRVAIKILLPESSHIDQVSERFKREARSAASIGHENIVDVYDLDHTEEDIVYIVMELLVGLDLAELLHKHGAVPVERAATIAVQTARALGAAHERDIIHRDLKPENIFLCKRKDREVVKIVDFGIAMIKEQGSLSRLTTDGILLGTPYYMSPEQARGVKELDHRVDIYALGAVLFETITSTVLFPGDTYLEVISKHQLQMPPALHERKKDLVCPKPMEDIIMKMLEKDPADRPASMDEVEKALLPFSSERLSIRPAALVGKSDEFAETVAGSDSLSAGAPKSHTTPVRWEEVEKPRKITASKVVLIAAGIIVIFVLSVLGAMALFNDDGEREADEVKTFPISAAPPSTLAGQNKAAEKNKVSISISAMPSDATIIVDGSVQKQNPVKVVKPRSSKEIAVAIEASGYIPHTQIIKLDQNHNLSVSLKEDPEKKAKQKLKKTVKKQTTTEPAESKGGKTKKPDKIIIDSPYSQ